MQFYPLWLSVIAKHYRTAPGCFAFCPSGGTMGSVILPDPNRAPVTSPRCWSFVLCVRQVWRRRKHGLVRRVVSRIAVAAHSFVENSVVCNTSGRAMTSGGSHTSSLTVPT
jgi:hypothetical protein